MRLSSIALFWAALAAGTGCGAGFDESIPPPDRPIPSDSATISFAHDGTLAIAPGEIVALEVRTNPPAAYQMTFALLGDALDASLDRTTVLADDEGKATVAMRAPSQSTSFVLRATLQGGSSADLPVAVSDQGFGSLRIVPKYSGKRPVLSWHAGVLSGTTCQQIAHLLPNDIEGALVAEASKKEEPFIEVAPVGPTLAVYVRSGHYMWGCSNETDLLPGETEIVEVHIVNKPIDASAMLLTTELDFSPEPMPWTTILSDGASALFSELGAGVPAPLLLLDAMEGASSDPLAFETASFQYGWESAIVNHFANNEIDLLGELALLAQSGVAGAPPLITGTLSALPQAPNAALFQLSSIAGAGATASAFPLSNVLSFAIDPDDVVHVGGKLYFLPSQYVAHTIVVEALAAHPQANVMADALAEIALCDELPLVLVGMNGCSGSCIADLCRQGLAAMWSNARKKAAGSVGEIALQISAPASFDDFAALTGFGGSWIGSVKHAGVEAKVVGKVAATPLDNGPE